MKLTLDQFCDQWAPGGSYRTILSRLEFNIFDFTTQAGEISTAHFKSSFDQGGMAGSGSSWPARQSSWGRKFSHPVLNDRGSLKASIQGKREKGSYGNFEKRGKGLNLQYLISTNEQSRAEKGKRGSNPNSNGSYAAIHNTDPSKHNFTRNQYTTLKPEQRQFMAPNKALEEKIAAIIPMIFKGIPNGT